MHACISYGTQVNLWLVNSGRATVCLPQGYGLCLSMCCWWSTISHGCPSLNYQYTKYWRNSADRATSVEVMDTSCIGWGTTLQNRNNACLEAPQMLSNLLGSFSILWLALKFPYLQFLVPPFEWSDLCLRIKPHNIIEESLCKVELFSQGQCSFLSML